MSRARPRIIEGQASALTWVGFVLVAGTMAGMFCVGPFVPLWSLVSDPAPPSRSRGSVIHSPDGRHWVTMVRVMGGGAEDIC